MALFPLLKERPAGEEPGIRVREISTKDIAVIGMAVRMPRAETAGQLWEILAHGVDLVAEFPEARRRDAERLAALAGLGGEVRYRVGAYLAEIDRFDHGFFRLSPAEASLMHPCQRLFLETAWRAIDDAGYGGKRIRGTRTGVFLGYSADAIYDYKRLLEGADGEAVVMAVPGNLSSIIAGRVSYLLDLHGPALVIDTACSSSLVAVHYACRALRYGECEMALAGGVKIMLLPAASEHRLGIESSDGRTRTFDDRSDGTGFGEGVAAFLLKPLAKALADGDAIHAVIKGSAVNQDGSSIGLTAPNARAQEDVIVRAWEDAGVAPETISYLEAHGTGTRLGDPIEIDGITRAFARFTERRQFCPIGSIKTNLGHLDSAAGAAGLAKAILSLEHGQIPPSLHFETPNREIDFANSPVFVNTALRDWPREGGPRRCGVSAFGLSGTNCHLILEEAPSRPKAGRENRPRLLTVSARTPASLRQAIAGLRAYVESNGDVDLDDLCYTMNTGREAHACRRAYVFEHYRELLRALYADEEADPEAGAGLDRVAGAAAHREGGGDELESLAALYRRGGEIDWERLYEGQRRYKLHLPPYYFTGRRCWFEAPEPGEPRVRIASTPLEVRLEGRDDGGYTELEKSIGQVWGGLLGYASLSIDASFYDLGGDSILALKAVNALERRLGVKLGMSELLDHDTVRKLAACLERHGSGGAAPIPRAAPKEYYRVSSAQKRLYVLSRFEGLGTGYNMPMVIEARGALDEARLASALQTVVDRHESLRTSFRVVEGEPVQIVHERLTVPLERFEAACEEIPALVKGFIRPFDLERPPLLRAGLVSLAPDRHLLLFDLHHIIADGISTTIFDRELIAAYEGRDLPQPALQYKDYAEWQNGLLDAGALDEHERYWLDRFAGEIPVLDFPTDFPRPSIQSFEGDRVVFKADAVLTGEIRRIAAETNTTLYMVLLAAYTVLLAKYTGREDLVVASPVHGRSHPQLENLVGMFVNTVLLRNQPRAGMTFRAYLQEVKRNALEAYAHQDYPFERLVEKVAVKRDLSRNPLFDTMLTLQNMGQPAAWGEEISFRNVAFDHPIAKFDLNLNVMAAEEITFDLEYCTRLFRRETIERLAGNFLAIFAQVAGDIEVDIAEITAQSPAETALQAGFADNYRAYPLERTIVDHLLDRAAMDPDAPAVEESGAVMTYGELCRQSGAVARALAQKGVIPGDVVGVAGTRSLSFVAAALGVMWSGAAYLPLNPDLPAERIAYMLENSGARLILREEETPGLDSAGLAGAYTIAELVRDGRGAEQAPLARPDGAAYVIYTSGSTGRPKGVAIAHRSLTNFLHCLAEQYESGVGAADRCLSLTSISFDVSVCELFLPLAFGACLVLHKNEIQGLAALADFIIARGITFAYIPPSILPDLQACLAKRRDEVRLNKMLVGVEPIKDHVLAAYHEINEGIEIVNGYGPTETTICATFLPYRRGVWDGNVPIGKPLANTHVYLVDRRLRPVPLGALGEICVSGVGVSLGYINNPALTAERFVPNPFQELEKAPGMPPGVHPGTVLYRTGDLARRRPDGIVEFLGRIDNQVKIRGYRVEPGEIENVLSGHPEIEQAVVVAMTDETSGRYLCAYVRARRDLALDEIRSYLGRFLPPYMIPAYVVRLDEFPVTVNGKIDRALLPKPEGIRRAFAPPATPAERALAEIFRGVLALSEIGLHDDFFELGGDSLKAIKAVERANQEGIPLSLTAIMQHKTIGAILADEAAAGTEAFLDVTPEIDRLPDYAELAYGGDAAKRRHNLAFRPVEYPYYFNCMLAITLEMLRYQRHLPLEPAFFAAAEGDAVLALGVARTETGEYLFPVTGRNAGFPDLSELFKVSGAFVHAKCQDEALSHIRSGLARDRLVPAMVNTYHLNYTRDYHLDQAVLLDRIAKSAAKQKYLPTGFIPTVHTLLIADETADGFVVYDTNFRYFGEVPAADFLLALNGFNDIPFMKGHDLCRAVAPYQFIEVDLDGVTEISQPDMGEEALARITAAFHNQGELRHGPDLRIIFGFSALAHLARRLAEPWDEAARDQYNQVFYIWTEALALWRNFAFALAAHRALDGDILEASRACVRESSRLYALTRDRAAGADPRREIETGLSALTALCRTIFEGPGGAHA